jgi:hypothetical protein
MTAQWTDDEVEGILKSLVVAAAVAGIGFYLFFPARQQREQAPPQQAPAGQNRQIPANPPPRAAQYNRNDDEDGIESFLKQHTRLPPHHLSTSADSTRQIHDGVVPFRFTKASIFESKMSRSADTNPSPILENRKDRARIFSKLFGARDVPSRGANIVISIPVPDCQNENLHRALFLLGTYYNLFLMIVLNDEGHISDYSEDKERSERIVSKLFSTDALPKDIISPHRIVVTRSVASRIAFVRSLPKNADCTPYVIAYENEDELSVQLTKFGYKVILRSVTTLLS